MPAGFRCARQTPAADTRQAGPPGRPPAPSGRGSLGKVLRRVSEVVIVAEDIERLDAIRDAKASVAIPAMQGVRRANLVCCIHRAETGARAGGIGVAVWAAQRGAGFDPNPNIRPGTIGDLAQSGN